MPLLKPLWQFGPLGRFLACKMPGPLAANQEKPSGLYQSALLTSSQTLSHRPINVIMAWKSLQRTNALIAFCQSLWKCVSPIKAVDRRSRFQIHDCSCSEPCFVQIPKANLDTTPPTFVSMFAEMGFVLTHGRTPKRKTSFNKTVLSPLACSRFTPLEKNSAKHALWTQPANLKNLRFDTLALQRAIRTGRQTLLQILKLCLTWSSSLGYSAAENST